MKMRSSLVVWAVVRLADPAAAVSQLEAAVAGRLQRRNAWQIIWPRPYRDMAYRVFEQLPIDREAGRWDARPRPSSSQRPQ